MIPKPAGPEIKPPYRPEIQGIRAVAALLVAIFHIWLGRVSGGVDVFFVVSGFLITTSLLGQAERHGGIDFAKFWAGLSRRLLPAALTVLVAIVVACVIWLPKARWGSTLREVVASALYVENWQLAFSAVDYLDRENEVSPLQHFWALSVQGQFYLMWPLLVALAIVLATRINMPVRRALVGLLATAFVASLVYSIIATASNQPFAYFNTFARVWEFALGGLLAALLPLLRLPQSGRVLLGWVGLLAMLSCGLILQVATVFPGYAALWPTLAAVLIIAAGTSGSRLGADRLLGSRPLVALGDISYGIYLWHWPILIFYRLYVGRTGMSLVDGLLILLPSILLAWVTTRFVEDPIRSAGRGSARPTRTLLVAGAVVSVTLLVTAAWAMHFMQAREFDRKQSLLGGADYPGASALEEGFRYSGAANVPVFPDPLYVKEDLPDNYDDNCHQSHEDATAISCEYGDKSAGRTIAIVGGSHAAQWLPAFQRIAEQNPWRIVTYTKSSCQLSADLSMTDGEHYHSCMDWNERLLAELEALRPEVVFTTGTRGVDRRDEIVHPGYLRQWKKLHAMGIHVIAIRDNPWMEFEVPECVERLGGDAPACARSRAESLAAESPFASLEPRPEGTSFIDLTRFFCDERRCFPVAGNVLIYRDKHHITAAYARTLAPALQRAILEVYPAFQSRVAGVQAPAGGG